jgi:hypothetical protein
MQGEVPTINFGSAPDGQKMAVTQATVSGTGVDETIVVIMISGH